MADDPVIELAKLELAKLHALEEQLRTENEQLLESQRLAEDARDDYIELYDHAPVALVTLDLAGVIQRMNLTAAMLLGQRERRLMIGLRFKMLIADIDHARLADHLRACSSADDATSCELRLKGGRGKLIPVQLWSRRSQSATRFYETALIDLSEEKHATREMRRLIEAEQEARAANEAKDRFIAVLSHELRTPLTPVLAAVSSLVDRSDVPAPLKATCQMVQRNVLTEARLIDDLLDVTRIVRGKLGLDRTTIDVHEAVSQALDLLEADIRAKELSVVTALEAKRHVANADSVRLRQVFWNVLSNATKFTPRGGRIELRSWNNGRTLAVEISDTGVGFEPTEVSRLFEAFEQDPDAARRRGGLGLGLAISRGIMDLHGGRISGSSRGPNQGARFVVEIETSDATADVRAIDKPASPLPLPASLPSPPPTSPGQQHLRRDKPRILLVEDDADTAEILRDILDGAGYQVRTADSVKAALAHELDTIDVVVSDLGLPDASGLDLMRQLRNRRNIRGIALSGYGTEADKRASREAGFSAHLTKPIEIKGLLATIETVGSL